MLKIQTVLLSQVDGDNSNIRGLEDSHSDGGQVVDAWGHSTRVTIAPSKQSTRRSEEEGFWRDTGAGNART